MESTNGVHTPLMNIERITYSGDSLTRDPVEKVDPEIAELMKKVRLYLNSAILMYF
jgi:hypothetical protein